MCCWPVTPIPDHQYCDTVIVGIYVGADSQVNSCDVFRNTALNYLSIKYAANAEMSDNEPALRQCLGMLARAMAAG